MFVYLGVQMNAKGIHLNVKRLKAVEMPIGTPQNNG